MIWFRNTLDREIVLCEHVKLLDAEGVNPSDDGYEMWTPVRVRCDKCGETFELSTACD